jgi:adenylate cyclase class IV
MSPRNLEIKLRLTPARLASLEATVRAAGLSVTVLDQIDTYFRVPPPGRLKLRQLTPEGGELTAELIAYQRPDLTGPRWSDYELLPLAPEVGSRLNAMLTASLGVRAVVTKRRRVAIRGRSRIHLDQVETLGCFLEIETVAQGDDDNGIDQELQATLEWLGVDPGSEEPIDGSYADLMRQHE